MSASLGPYLAYKDSGVEWLGRMPEHWEARRLKSLLSRNDSGVWGEDFDDDGVIVLRSTEQTVAGEWKISAPAKRRLTPFEYSSSRLQEGDLVITKSSGSSLHIGKTSIVTRQVEALDCCFSNFMQRLRVKQDATPHYLWYVLNGELGRRQFDYMSDTTTGLANLNGKVIGRVCVACPPIAEQSAIVRFLDHADRRIRRYIRAKERLIELLEEKKQATIHQAVTGQIDVRTGQPYPAYKASGVDGFSDVPAHWKVWRIKTMFRLRTEKSGVAHGSELLSIYTHIGVRPRRELEEKGNKASTTDDYWIVKKGDLILNKLLAWMGAVGVSHYDGVTSPAYDILMPIVDLASDYYHYLFRTRIYLKQFKKRSEGYHGYETSSLF